MVLDVDKLALGVDTTQGVTAVGVVEASPPERATVTEEHQAGVVSLWPVCEEIEQSVKIEQENQGRARTRRTVRSDIS